MTQKKFVQNVHLVLLKKMEKFLEKSLLARDGKRLASKHFAVCIANTRGLTVT